MLTIGSLFSGYGGLDLAVQTVLGGTLAWYSEVDAAACTVLAAHHPDVPNLGDLTQLDWEDVLTMPAPRNDDHTRLHAAEAVSPGSPTVDIVTAGYP